MARWKSAPCRGGILLCLALPALLTGCRNEEGWPWERNMFDSPGPVAQESALEPPEGTVPAADEAVAGITAAPPAGGERERGAALYLQYCAVCHGETGRGRELPGDYVTPDLTDPDYRDYEDADFHDIIVEGGLNMPDYREELSERERWLVIAWMRELQETDGD
jgi:mono/diheme cytochrome c family protein